MEPGFDLKEISSNQGRSERATRQKSWKSEAVYVRKSECILSRKQSPMSTIAVCSWSLQAKTPAELVELVKACGVNAVQLHLDPIRTFAWRADETASRLKVAGISLISGMMSTKDEDYTTLESIQLTGGVRPDATWDDNLRAAEGNAILSQRLGLRLITLHAGFLPHELGHPVRKTMVDRIVQMAGIFGARGVRVALETGQETAETLVKVLAEINASLPEAHHVGVNFDPANMILYGMGDPVDSLKQLLPSVMQLHIKDAVPTMTPNTWGTEVRAGTGAVNFAQLLQVLKSSSRRVDLAIEREAGDDRVGDVRAARSLVMSLL